MKQTNKLVVFWFICFTLIASPASAEDFNSTYTHFLLTSGQNIKLELERLQIYIQSILDEEQLEALQQSATTQA